MPPRIFMRTNSGIVWNNIEGPFLCMLLQTRTLLYRYEERKLMSGVHSEHNLRENTHSDPAGISNDEENQFVLPVLPAAKKLIWNETGELF